MKIAGVQGVIELPASYSYTKEGGRIEFRRFKGPPALMDAHAAILEADGTAHDYDRNPGEYIITVRAPGAENQNPNTPLADEWTMEVNDREVDTWELPQVQKVLAYIVPESRANVRNIFEALLRGETKFTYPAIGNNDPVTANISLPMFLASLELLVRAVGGTAAATQAKGVFTEFFGDRAAGHITFYQDQYVLRRSRIVTADTEIQAAGTNNRVGYIFTPSALKSTEKAPASITGFGPLPIGIYPNEPQWLKRRPKATQEGGGRWSVVQEYWHADRWSKLSYPNRL